MDKSKVARFFSDHGVHQFHADVSGTVSKSRLDKPTREMRLIN